MSHSIGGLDPLTVAALEELGDGLRRLRADHLLSQAALAERCGRAQSTISRVENGKAPGLRLAWLARIVAGYNVDSGWPEERRWQAEAPASHRLLLERFGRSGNLPERLRQAQLVRQQSLDRLMRQQASRREDPRRRERDFGS